METENRGWGISGFTLKMTAVISMLIDHCAATVLERILRTATPASTPYVSAHWQEFYNLYTVCRYIGRLAFPIYCFLLVEGFLHTRSVAKYAARLFVFALLSEVPFDLAFQESIWDVSYNNVFLTLTIGLLVIWGIKSINEHIAQTGKRGELSYAKLLLRSILCMFIIFAGMGLAEYVVKSDYGAAGVATIVVLYLLRSHPKMAFLVAVIILAKLTSEIELVALFDVLLLALYNGKRGRQMKLFFYAFYPVHLLILSGICVLLGLGI